MLVLPVGYLLAFFVFPFFWLLGESLTAPNLTLEYYSRALFVPVYGTTILRTVLLSSAVAVACVAISFPLALWMTTIRGRLRGFVLVCVAVPLWTSVLVRSYAWIIILQRHGIVNEGLRATRLISDYLPLLYNWFSIFVGVLYVMLPFMITILYVTFRRIDPHLIQAALSLGASREFVFRNVFLPLVMPGVAAGVLVVFALTMGYFITPALLGGRGTTMIAMIINTQMNQTLDWPFASALAIILMVVVIATTGFAALLYRRLARYGGDIF